MKAAILLSILVAFLLSFTKAQSNNCDSVGKNTANVKLRTLLRQKCLAFMAVQTQAISEGALKPERKVNFGRLSGPNGTPWKPSPYPDAAHRLRKEIRTLTDQEWSRFVKAVQTLKKRGDYDILVAHHLPSQGTFAHYGAAFLPWHREYLHRYEESLRLIDHRVTIPYWDSTLDEALPDPKDSIMWTDKFLGGGDGEVKDGPFANWTSPLHLFTKLNLFPWQNFLKTSKILRRSIGQSPSLPSRADFQSLFQGNSYENLIWINGSRKFENLHGIPHVFVGGHMGEIISASVDPVFWMHHALIDCVWAEYRQTRQSSNTLETSYTSNIAILGGDGHKGSAPLLPWKEKTPIDGLSNYYRNGFYRCAPRPTCSSTQPSCGPYLFCDAVKRCVSQIKAGGNCKGFDGVENACQNGYYCTGGRCTVRSTAKPSPNTCRSDTECSSGTVCCRGSCSRECQVPPGGSCTTQKKCTSGHVCCRGKCSRTCEVLPGRSCTTQSKCTSGHVCCNNKCSTSCVPSGGPCTARSVCSNGFKCCSGTCQRQCTVAPSIQCGWWTPCPQGLKCCNDDSCKTSCPDDYSWFRR